MGPQTIHECMFCVPGFLTLVKKTSSRKQNIGLTKEELKAVEEEERMRLQE